AATTEPSCTRRYARRGRSEDAGRSPVFGVRLVGERGPREHQTRFLFWGEVEEADAHASQRARLSLGAGELQEEVVPDLGGGGDLHPEAIVDEAHGDLAAEGQGLSGLDVHPALGDVARDAA